jgi:hypothetical protein
MSTNIYVIRIAPAYTITRANAINSASSKRNKPAVDRTTKTKYKALYTGLECVIIRIAAAIEHALKMTKKTPWLVSSKLESEPMIRPNSHPTAATQIAIMRMRTESFVGRNAANNAKANVKQAM